MLSSTSLFHLRPVRDHSSSSPASSTSITPPIDASTKPNFASARSPSRPNTFTLRDVDLSQNERATSRPYPAPPTGHELMAMFPPTAPVTEAHPITSTSGLFRHQERAFFAQAGKEIVRVKLDPDLNSSYAIDRKHRQQAQRQQQWAHHSPALPHRIRSNSRPPPQHTSQSHQQSPASASPINIKQRLPSPQESMLPPAPKPDLSNEEYRADDPDEAWRRPMPFAERRRAGKHTRRVIVQKN